MPEGWAAPDADALSALVPEAQRSVRFAGFMARLEVTAASDRLRLAVGVTRIAADLAPQRRRWLDVALDEASALGMARVVVRDQTVEAEFDLSGVPTFLLQPLVAAGVHALDACFRRLVVPASVIGGPFSSRMLERSPEDWHSKLQPIPNLSRRSDA